jgi:glycosyltransferase 2 family protein
VTSTSRRVIATVFLIVGAGAIGVALAEAWNDSRTGDLVPSWWALLIALGILAVGFVGVAWGWISLFPRSADRIHLARAVYLSQLGKYVPGGVWQPSSQVALARSAGVTLADAAVAFPVSVIAVVAAAATTAGVLLVLPGSPLSGGMRAVVGLGPLTLVLLHRSWMAKALELARRRVKRIPHHAVLPQQSQISASTAWLFLAVVGQGLSYAWLIHDLDGRVGLIPATGGFALAWLVGFVAVPIPAGLGLREAVLVGVLGSMTGAPTVLAAAVAHRLVNIACEILMIAGNRLHLAWHARRRPETKPVTVQPSKLPTS